MGKVYDADSLLAHVKNDKDKYKDNYKDKDILRTPPKSNPRYL